MVNTVASLFYAGLLLSRFNNVWMQKYTGKPQKSKLPPI